MTANQLKLRIKIQAVLISNSGVEEGTNVGKSSNTGTDQNAIRANIYVRACPMENKAQNGHPLL